MTTASVAASPGAAPGATPGSARGPGAAAAAAAAAAAGARASGEAAAPRPTAGSAAGATAGTAAAAPEALPRGQAPGRGPGVTRALRRGVLVVETSFAQKSTAPSLLITFGQAGERVLRRRKMAEEVMVKGQAHHLKIAMLVQQGRQRVTAALKIRIP